jgi:hypothetical protein
MIVNIKAFVPGPRSPQATVRQAAACMFISSPACDE